MLVLDVGRPRYVSHGETPAYVSGWTEANGTFQSRNTGANIPVETVYAGGFAWTDYSMEADVIPLSNRSVADAGILLRFQAPTLPSEDANLAICRLFRDGSGQSHLQLIVTNPHVGPGEIVTVPFSWVAQSSYRLRASAESFHLRCEVVGVPEAAISLVSNVVAPMGTIGLRATHIPADYDNVQVVDLAADSDDDGVPDNQDTCPGFDDNVDPDGDGTPNGCDACPDDFYNDSDGDSSCDSSDICPLDAQNDADQDGTCADADPCPLDPANDADQDGICGDVDSCPLDTHNDADGDGVCGDLDECPGGNDNADGDGDGTPDACDACPDDYYNDSDGDGSCDGADPCPLDAQNDADQDGTCAGDDPCPLDPVNDADQDGICGDLDPCPTDAANDADGDGICESDDNCPTVPNDNQSDADGDGTGDACEPDNDSDGIVDDNDNCPLDANVDQADGDGDGAGDVCDADDDNDGVVDGADECLGTPPGEPVLSNGCSVDQQCPCDAPWKNHGAYVVCVVRAANQLLAHCTITIVQWLHIVSEAAQSSCGRRNGC
jgi:hypothetical protein